MERSFENVVLEVDAVDGYPERKETAKKVYFLLLQIIHLKSHKKNTIE